MSYGRVEASFDAAVRPGLARTATNNDGVKLFTGVIAYAYDVHAGAFRKHRSVLVDGLRIVAFDEDPAGTSVERVACEGATLLPAFADCHVHLTDTGLFLDERNLNRTRSYQEFAAQVTRVAREWGVVFAGQYDESAWKDGRVADAAPLERAHPDARAMLVRVDGHSCIVNRATFIWLNLPDGIEGIERDADGRPTGKLFLDANWRAQSAFMEAMPLEAKRAAEQRAAELARSNGIVHVHAQLVGFRREQYAEEIDALRALPGKWYPKICTPDPHLAAELGLRYVGGDVFVDGSIGSRTAAVSEPFCGTHEHGKLRYSDDELLDYFAAAQGAGIAAGVHAIGDRAIEQCVRTWERVLGERPAGVRHFIEHFEIATEEQIEACARMGVYLSMQPQFDALWGGEGAMYDERLGTRRMHSMNALGRAQRAGAVLCGGSDSPVCELSALHGMQAAIAHHEPRERLTSEEALLMYTFNAAKLGYVERQTGVLAPGYAADFVLLDRDPLAGGRFDDCTVLQTWSDGECIFSRQTPPCQSGGNDERYR